MALQRTIASSHVGPTVGGCSRATLVIALLLVGGFAAFGVTDADAANGGDLTISPAPNTPDVNPQTQISVLGVEPQKIKSVAVTGAASGAHSGSLHAYSGNRGASFVLDQPLTEGESVSATVKVKGRKPIDFGFTVADLGPTQPPLKLTLDPARQAPALRHRAGADAAADRRQPQLGPRAARRRDPAHPAALAGRPPGQREHGDDQARRPGRADAARRARADACGSTSSTSRTSPRTCACSATAASGC